MIVSAKLILGERTVLFVTPEKDDDIIRRQLDMLINMYEHHLDLFLKWITLYATVVAAVAVYVFNQAVAPETRRLLPLLIAAASLMVSVGCFAMWSWLKELEKEVREALSKSGETHCPPFLGIRMTVLALVMTAGFAVSNVVYSIFGKFS